MIQLGAVVIGGGLGSGARYVLAMWVMSRVDGGFPWGTLTVNVVGSFLLGALMQLALSTSMVNAEVRLLLATGFLGGFTTYSTFNYETLMLFQAGQWATALVNVGATVGVCLVSGLLAALAVRTVFGA